MKKSAFIYFLPIIIASQSLNADGTTPGLDTLPTFALLPDVSGSTSVSTAYGKEYSHNGLPQSPSPADVDETGTPVPAQVLDWDGIKKVTTGGGLTGGHRNGINFGEGINVDAIANHNDALFDLVYSVPGAPSGTTGDATALLYSEKVVDASQEGVLGLIIQDPQIDLSGGSLETVERHHIKVQPAGIGSAGSEFVWAKSRIDTIDMTHLGGTDEEIGVLESDLSSHPFRDTTGTTAGFSGLLPSTTSDVDGLNMWERTEGADTPENAAPAPNPGFTGATMFSAEGDGIGDASIFRYNPDTGGGGVYLAQSVLDAAVLDFHANILQNALEPFLPGALVEFVHNEESRTDLDALMVSDQSSEDLDDGDRIIFSLAPSEFTVSVSNGPLLVDSGTYALNGGAVYTGLFEDGALELDFLELGGISWQGKLVSSGWTVLAPISGTLYPLNLLSGIQDEALPGGMYNIDALEALGAAVPEPSTYALIGSFLGIAVLRKKRAMPSTSGT